MTRECVQLSALKVPFEAIDVASPDGRHTFSLLGNPERLTFRVTMGDTTVIEPSAIRLHVDGFVRIGQSALHS